MTERGKTDDCSLERKERCPPLAVLLLIVEGELPPRRAARVREHVKRCVACRQEIYCAQAFESVGAVILEEELEGDPEFARQLSTRESRFQRALHLQKQMIVRPAPSSPMRRWLPVAALVPLLMLGFMVSRTTSVVRASELLSRAAMYEQSVPAGRSQRIRIRLTPADVAFLRPPSRVHRVAPFTTVRDIDRLREPQSSIVIHSQAEQRIEQMLAKHGFTLRHPLGLAGFAAWRASLRDLRDSVVVTGDFLLLRTTTSEGLIRQAELVVQRKDYDVVRLILALEGLGRLEMEKIANIDAPPVPSSVTPSAPPAVVRQPPRLARFVERTFGNNGEGPKFVPELTSRAASLRRGLRQLQGLEREGDANVDARALDLYEAVRKDLNALEGRINILYGSANRSLPSTGLPADWRRRATEALRHSTRLERLIEELLTHDDLPPARGRHDVRKHPTGISATFAALWETVQGEP